MYLSHDLHVGPLFGKGGRDGLPAVAEQCGPALATLGLNAIFLPPEGQLAVLGSITAVAGAARAHLGVDLASVSGAVRLNLLPRFLAVPTVSIFVPAGQTVAITRETLAGLATTSPDRANTANAGTAPSPLSPISDRSDT